MSQPSDSPVEPASAPDAERRRLLTDPRLPARSLGRHPDDGWRLAEPLPMRPGTRRAFHALIAALLPPPPAPRVPVERIEEAVRRLLRYTAPLAARAFGFVVLLLDLSPLWRLQSPRRLRSLPAERASRILDGIAHSRFGPLRQLLMVARGAVLSMYFDQDEVHRAIGYEPEGFMRERGRLHERLAAGQAPSAEDLIGPHSENLQ